MVDLVIPDVDPVLVEALRTKAARRRQTIEEMLREILDREGMTSMTDRAREAMRIRAMSPRTFDDSTDLIRAERDGR